jgi:energy-coupling factor transporter ATP-binding protein EcfA2
MLTDLNITFPKGELSLVCGKLGSGKTLLLLGTYYLIIYTITCSNWGTALLGEADLLTGQVLCPKTPPDAIASFADIVPSPDKWVIDGVCAYVPQVCLGCFLYQRWGFHLSLSECVVAKCFDQR